MNAPTVYEDRIGPPGDAMPRTDADAELKLGRRRARSRAPLRAYGVMRATELADISRPSHATQGVAVWTDVWLNRLAAAAAPNPLSMLTTVTPVAQLFSMDSSAAMPPKLAP